MPRRQRTNAELVDYSNHVLYEMEQLAEAAERLAASEVQGADLPKVISNALLESIAIHARNLVEFAYMNKAKAMKHDCVIAAEYIPKWQGAVPNKRSFYMRWRAVPAGKSCI